MLRNQPNKKISEIIEYKIKDTERNFEISDRKRRLRI